MWINVWEAATEPRKQNPRGNMMVWVPSRGLKRNLSSGSVLKRASETRFQVVYEIRLGLTLTLLELMTLLCLS